MKSNLLKSIILMMALSISACATDRGSDTLPADPDDLVSAQDLRSMLGELTGETPEDAMQVFSAQYVQMQEGDLCYMYGTGDFGDAGPFYFGDGQMTVENGRICITGSVMTYDTGAGSYVPGKTYRAYFSTEGGATGNPCILYPFAEVSVSG